jgi:hypothetical protein
MAFSSLPFSGSSKFQVFFIKSTNSKAFFFNVFSLISRIHLTIFINLNTVGHKTPLKILIQSFVSLNGLC